MTATNMCSNFGSKWSGLPLSGDCYRHNHRVDMATVPNKNK